MNDATTIFDVIIAAQFIVIVLLMLGITIWVSIIFYRSVKRMESKEGEN